MGLIAVFKFAGVLVVLALAATTPALMARFPHKQAETDTPVAQPAPATLSVTETSPADGSAKDTAPGLVSLDDQALCLAWRRSFRLLETALSPMDRLCVVEQRQKYLGNPLPYVEDARRRAS